MKRIMFIKVNQLDPESGYNLWVDGRIVTSCSAGCASDIAFHIEAQEQDAIFAQIAPTKLEKHANDHD